MTTKDVVIDNYFVKDGALLKVTSTSGTKINANINPGDVTSIPTTAASLLAIGFVADGIGNYRCSFAHFISVPANLAHLAIGENVRLPLPPIHRLQNIVKFITEQSVTVDEEALKDAALGGDLAAPTVTLTSRTSTGFVVGWAAVANAAGYQVSIDDGVTYGETQVGRTFTKEDATATTTYPIKVIAVVGEGSIYRNSYPGSLSVVTLTPLAAPSLTLVSKTSTTFEVSWEAVAHASGYKVSIDNGTTYGETQAGVSFTKNDAVATTTYPIKVKAIGATIYEDSPASEALSVVTQTPLAATVLTAGTITATTFALSWPAITNAVGYKVSIDNGVTYGETQVGLTYEKADATAETTYQIFVKAIAEAATIYEDSVPSALLEIETLAS